MRVLQAALEAAERENSASRQQAEARLQALAATFDEDMAGDGKVGWNEMRQFVRWRGAAV